MQYRELGRTGFKVSAISFGAWAIGGGWGVVDGTRSLARHHKAGILARLPLSTGGAARIFPTRRRAPRATCRASVTFSPLSA